MSGKPTYEELEKRIRELEKAESESKRLKKELAHSHRLLNYIISHARSSIAVHDRDLNYLYVSNRYLEEYKVKDQNIIGKHHYEVFPDLPQKWRDVHQRSLKGEVLSAEEDPYYREDGSVDWTRWECRPWYDADDSIGGFIVYTEITNNRRQIEAELEYERSFLSAVFDNIEEAIVICDAEGRLWRFNEAARNLHGIPEKPLKPDQWAEYYNLYEKDGRTPLPQKDIPLFQALKGEHVKGVEIVVAPKYSKPHFLICNGQALRNEAGKVIGAAVAMYDITERKMAEAALQKSEEKYRRLYEEAAIGIFHSSFEGQFLDVNPALAKMLGYETPQEVIDSIYNIAEQIYAEPKVRDDVIDQALAKGETVKLENLYRRKDGSVWNAYLYLRYVSDSKGRPIYLEGFVEDITDRKRAEEALKESKIFLESMTDVAYTADDKGDLLWVNPAAERVTGISQEDIIGKSFLPLFVESDHASLMDVYKRTLAGESLENTLTFKTGIICHFTSLPKRNKNGDIIGTFGVARDITEKLRMEQALRDSEQMYRTTFDAIPDSITVTRQKDGKYKYVNDGFYNITGYSHAEVIGKTPFEINLYVNQSDRERMVKTLQQNGELLNFEIPFRKKDGTIWDSFFSARPIVIDGEACLIALTKDVTEFKKAEEEKNKLEAQLRQAQKMESVGRLAGGVAHDFNNMLSVIMGNTEMGLEEIETTQPIYDNLQEIQKAAARSTKVVRQLLSFARKQTIAPKVLDLNETVEDLLKMLRRLLRESIDLAWRPGTDIWPVKIDPGQIDQILVNLTVNARDAIKEVGRLTIETGRQTFDQEYCNEHPGFIPGEFVMLAVSDNGCGMDKTTLNNLFEPFYTTKGVGEGTGLGLATVYGIVKQNNGFINVYSEPGQGSTFNIYFPRFLGDVNTDKAIPEKKTTARGTETILLVEDEPAILRMTRIMLERRGYRVLPANTPAEAMIKAKKYCDVIDLLMTDVVMPGKTGHDLAEQITAVCPDIQVLFMSGYTANVIAHQGVLDDGVAFIQKPFSNADLAEKLREVLDTSSAKTQ